MTLAQMRASLRGKIGNPTTSQVADSVLTGFLNDAYRFILGRYRFPAGRKTSTAAATVANTATIALPADLVALIRVWDITNSTKLRKVGPRFLASLPANIPVGKPKYYLREQTQITLVPTPDAVYSIGMYYQPVIVALSADGDIPSIPDFWHDGIVLKARHIYYDEKGDVGKAIYASNQWKDWVADKPTETDTEKDDLDDSGVIIDALGSGYSRLGPRDRRFDPLFDITD